MIDWKIFAWGIILGVLPAAALFVLKIRPHPYWHRLLIAPVAFGVLAIVLTLSPNTGKWIDKNGLELGGRILPWSYVANTVRYFDEDHERYMRATQIPRPALLGYAPYPPVMPAPRPRLAVLPVCCRAAAEKSGWACPKIH